jgi:hypothetical protein
MRILEEINNMRNQGMSDREISGALQEKGLTPRTIDDAFNRIKIKNAIVTENEELIAPAPIPNRESGEASQSFYTPKRMEVENPPEEIYATPIIEETTSSREGGYSNEEYSPSTNEEYYPQEGYGEVESGGGYDSETFIEIAEQVFSEKIKKEQNQIEALNEFATLAETKISNNHERIKRIETIIDKLQIAILEKVGSYGKNLESIKNEMEMMQNSFEKIVPKLHETNSKHKKTYSAK